ncbi:TPA: hypothetical protein TU171_001781 [Streptococcus equi subsp. zooepidemicus]|uniref:hypothetical protein n=1 Tax=Streptococcus equi TaxID=1336 RepID=UPI001E50F4F4|nr:hypothetical protein [Streptococcus equi]MCD3389478.1 hypothetical protein [Streptococcus equi subsp. zooepidemicus]MDI5952381.1 hypothetical protein [Streptococcus equi subsp. zooepidemicus]MDI6074273.1 hypothetical protein [Streptococcus equi subsp. zooepidemicus]HEK9994767.1 hypothetical protein [Streptococcus equi subsp. zooepidemicus]HEL0046858.1 hypothetical protein [Streptococcus equi subsp. zooepidemicus]
MERSQLTWEDVSQYEEIKGYGQQVWKHQGEYYLVREEGGIATQRVVYKLPNELFQLLDSGRKSLLEIDFYVKNNCWLPTEEEKRASDKAFLQRSPIALIADPTSWELFTQEELRKLIPIAEQKWIDWKGKLPDDYVSPLK